MSQYTMTVRWTRGEHEFTALHRRAHEECYLANSVRSEVIVEPTQSLITG